nr:hypothetical protein Iba_chr14eCG0790 [Ipomoea batatas]
MLIEAIFKTGKRHRSLRTDRNDGFWCPLSAGWSKNSDSQIGPQFLGKGTKFSRVVGVIFRTNAEAAACQQAAMETKTAHHGGEKVGL